LPEHPVEVGLPVDVDLSILIDEIYVSPAAGKWVRNVSADLVEKYGLVVNVLRSRLADDPIS